MCGIIGILGKEPAAPRLLDALKRLEYRGYDSAGVATLERGSLVRRRAEGKLAALDRLLSSEPLSGECRGSAIRAGPRMALPLSATRTRI